MQAIYPSNSPMPQITARRLPPLLMIWPLLAKKHVHFTGSFVFALRGGWSWAPPPVEPTRVGRQPRQSLLVLQTIESLPLGQSDGASHDGNFLRHNAESAPQARRGPKT